MFKVFEPHFATVASDLSRDHFSYVLLRHVIFFNFEPQRKWK